MKTYRLSRFLRKKSLIFRLIALAFGVSFFPKIGLAKEVPDPKPNKALKAMSPTNPKTISEARVAASWQETMLKKLANIDATEAFGLFSEGGWSDAGQIFVIVKRNLTDKEAKGHPQMLLIYGKPNQRNITFERDLTSEEISKFSTLLGDFDTLSDVNITMFDGLVFELIHAKVDGPNSKPTIASRILYSNPGTQKKFPAHDKIIESMQSLRPRE